MAVPEEGDLLFQRAAGDQHALGEPGGDTADLAVIGEAEVVALVDDGLEVSGAGGPFELDAHAAAVGRSLADGHSRPFLRGRREIGRGEDPGFDEGRNIDVLDLLVIDEFADGVTRGHRGEALDFCRSAPEACAFEEMGSAVVIPVGGGDGSEVAGPAVVGRAVNLGRVGHYDRECGSDSKRDDANE